MEVGKLSKIQYTNAKDETSHRTVVSVHIPNENVKVIDVSELSPKESNEIAGMIQDYADYVNNHNKQLFTFEHFVEQQHNIHIEPKWRTLNITRISEE